MPAGIYLHIPFCKSRCSYCDFATDVYRNPTVVERYVDALCKEIARFDTANPKSKIQNPKSADTVYFGGGTPSLLTPGQVEKILTAVAGKFSVCDNAEITMEMNPGTVTPESLGGYRSLGVNRASFGVQTFDDRALALLARGHNAEDARMTFELLRKAGFDNISFDLIAGLPGQTLSDWERNLNEAIAMRPEHLSLYLLEIHAGTPLADQVRSGRRPRPDDEVSADMYEMMLDRLTSAGYEQYEISNFTIPGFESRHNSKYWRLDPVFGFGVSAHSFDGFARYSNERDTAAYVTSIENTGAAEVSREKIDAGSEFAFLGLRLNEGIDLDTYRERFGADLESRYETDLQQICAAGLIEIVDRRLRLTPKGRLFSNEVFAIFV